jgi:hypothetical protein
MFVFKRTNYVIVTLGLILALYANITSFVFWIFGVKKKGVFGILIAAGIIKDFFYLSQPPPY